MTTFPFSFFESNKSNGTFIPTINTSLGGQPSCTVSPTFYGYTGSSYISYNPIIYNGPLGVPTNSKGYTNILDWTTVYNNNNIDVVIYLTNIKGKFINADVSVFFLVSPTNNQTEYDGTGTFFIDNNGVINGSVNLTWNGFSSCAGGSICGTYYRSPGVLFSNVAQVPNITVTFN